MSLISSIKNLNGKSAYKNRLKYLQSKNWDVSIYEEPIETIINNLKGGAKSLVLYGEPQAGKTEVMIALVCRLLDEGRKTIFVIMNDNTELEVQNFNRFKSASQLNPSPMTAEQFSELPEEDKKSDIQRVIFCRKNAANLSKLIIQARFLQDRIILDDEADYASPDTKVNKDTDPSRINKLVADLGQLDPSLRGTYIGVTATPGRLDLNRTFDNDTTQWVFLKSHSQYKGREFFFPITEQQIEKSNYILTTMPDEGDDTQSLKEAVLRFLVRTAIVNLIENSYEQPMGYSMLIHTDGTVAKHEEDQKQVQKHLSVLINEKQPRADNYVKYMLEIAEKEIIKNQLPFGRDIIVSFVLEYIGKSQTLILNHKKDRNNVKAACEPQDIFTFAFGGNIISRGLTFDRLLTFYFTRNVKNKLQQNTYIQRARMFGTRPYSKFIEICVPKTLFANWTDCFFDHELSLLSAKSGNYVHINSRKTSSADTAAIKKSATVSFGDEWLLGDVVTMHEELEQRFSERHNSSVTEFIDELMSTHVLPDGAIDKSMWEQIKSMFVGRFAVEPKLVLAADGRFIYPGNYKDFDEETIKRDRGGLILATIQGRPDFDGAPLIMPVKNNFGQMRFYFKNNMGKKVIKTIS